MNKNSTQKEIRNFVSKISNFFKNVPILPAKLRGAGNFIPMLNPNLAQLPPASKSIIVSFLSFIYCQNSFVKPVYVGFSKSQLMLKPIMISKL